MNDQSEPLARFRSKPAATVIEEDGKRYLIREGQRVEVFETPQPSQPKTRRQEFEVEFVQFPARWAKALRSVQANGSTWGLAYALLAEAFKREHLGGDVILSTFVTGMPRNTKRKAARELQKLNLIHIEYQREKQSPIIYVIVSVGPACRSRPELQAPRR